MAERRTKILLYVPVVWPDDSGRKIVALAKELAALAGESGDELTILATPMDLMGGPVVWPHNLTGVARILPPVKLEPHLMPEGSREGFQQFSDLADRHDVAFIPQAFGAIPSDCRLRLSIPVVLGIPHLDFDSIDNGARTDRYRREMARLARFGQHFVFPTETLRAAAAEGYAIPSARSSVVRESGTAVFPSAETVRALGLPVRYLLSVGWDRPRQETEFAAEAIADLFRRGMLPDPFVAVSEGIDRRPLASLEQLRHAERCRAILQEAGMRAGRDWFEPEQLEPQELHAVLAGATAILGNGPRGAGPNWHTLSALRSGVPAINPVAEGYEIDPHRAFPFDPQSADSLASAIVACCGDATEANRRAEAARQLTTGANARQLHEILTELSADRCPISYPMARPPKPRDQRVAWLISHTTLRDAEVPILRQLGYEVYTNKVLPTGDDYRSGSTDFSWDDDSTLPTDVLNAVNTHNFYQSELNDEMSDTLNTYFGTIICAAYPLLLRQLAKWYRGRILVRVFGREHPLTYGDYIGQFAQGWLWQQLWGIQHRFWVAACYGQIPTHEDAFLRQRSALLPLALPERSLRQRDLWTGRDARVFFVCPSIHTAPNYYGKIYRQFLESFGDLPYVLGGAQPIPVNDPNVTGFMTEEQFTHFLVELRVMYYHSREPRHLHYHPLEAIAMGMPVVYLRGGLMEFYDTGSQAGACATEAEAKEKLLRILKGDPELVASIQSSQRSILKEFLPGYNLEAWARLFSGGVMEESCIPELQSLKPLSIGNCPPNGLVPDENKILIHEVERAEFRSIAREERAAEQPAPIAPPRKHRVRDFLPKPMQTSARAVFRSLKSVRRSILRPAVSEAAPVDTPKSLTREEFDAQFLTDPPPRPVWGDLPCFPEFGLKISEFARVLRGDRWNFLLDPIGVLDPNQSTWDIRRERLIVGFTHLAWETEDGYGGLMESACRESLHWCRLAEHVVFVTEWDRALAVRRYGLDPIRTSVLPALALTGGIPNETLPLTKHIDAEFGIPPTYLLGYYSKKTNPNTWLLIDALRILIRRKVDLPALVLTESVREHDAGRSSIRIEADTAKALNSLGLVVGENLILLPVVREARRRSLEVRACLSVVVPRWGANSVRDVARAALARVPVIASSILPIVEIFGASGDNVLLVDPDDHVGLANAIQRTLEFPEETRRRAERAYSTATRLNSPVVLGERERLFAAIAAGN